MYVENHVSVEIYCFPASFMSASLSKSQHDSDAEDIQTMNRVASAANLIKHMTAGGRAEYIGVALPIDVTMLFEVKEATKLSMNHLCLILSNYKISQNSECLL